MLMSLQLLDYGSQLELVLLSAFTLSYTVHVLVTICPASLPSKLHSFCSGI